MVGNQVFLQELPQAAKAIFQINLFAALGSFSMSCRFLPQVRIPSPVPPGNEPETIPTVCDLGLKRMAYQA